MPFARRSLLLGAATSAGLAAVGQRRLLTPSDRTRNGRVVSVLNFGARGDGRSDDRPAIQAAIDSLARTGGGTVLFPPGVYALSRAGKSAVAISLRSNIVLEGEGSKSILKLRGGSGGHLVNVTRETNCAVINLVLDGNRIGQPSIGHAFRSGGVAGLRLENLVIKNAYHYGIGLEAGSNRNIIVRRVVIQDCGGDGIDIKNKNNDNAAVRIEDVTVRRWGLRGNTQTQAAVDCRGRVALRNVRISDPGAEDSVGLRMRQGELRDAHGLGAHHSIVDRFEISMGDGQKRVGMNVVARHVSVSNGTISGGFRGLVVQDGQFRGKVSWSQGLRELAFY